MAKLPCTSLQSVQVRALRPLHRGGVTHPAGPTLGPTVLLVSRGRWLTQAAPTAIFSRAFQ